MDTEYECTLSEDCLKQAIEELDEDPKNRLSSVQTLREWIEQQPHLTCPTDTSFLLKFLRNAKFSQLRARETLEGYLTLKVELPNWYNNFDPKDPDVAKFLETGVFIPLPGYLKNGLKVVLIRFREISLAMPETMTAEMKDAYWRYEFMTMIYFLYDENIQVSGLLYLLDFSHFPLRLFTMFTPAETKQAMRFQGNVPGRFKAFYHYNEGPVIDAMLALFQPFMSKKMKERLRFFGSNLEEIYKEIPKSMFPIEYLPDDYDGPNAGSVDSLRDQFHKDITEEHIRKKLLYESDSKWRCDKSKKPVDIPNESFRKLNIE